MAEFAQKLLSMAVKLCDADTVPDKADCYQFSTSWNSLNLRSHLGSMRFPLMRKEVEGQWYGGVTLNFGPTCGPQGAIKMSVDKNRLFMQSSSWRNHKNDVCDIVVQICVACAQEFCLHSSRDQLSLYLHSFWRLLWCSHENEDSVSWSGFLTH